MDARRRNLTAKIQTFKKQLTQQKTRISQIPLVDVNNTSVTTCQ